MTEAKGRQPGTIPQPVPVCGADKDKIAELFPLLNQRQRWQLADLVKEHNLPSANAKLERVQPRRSFYTRIGKRIIDVAVSSVALIVTLPVTGAVLLAVGLTSGRPVVFTQERTGKDGRPFTLVKPRTMRDERDAEGRPLLGKHRVTKVGKVLRRTSLDELLNFWSVLKGDMSLIGPRPLLPEYLDRYSDRHRQRLAVRPGLNCPSLDRDADLNDYNVQFENDVWYVANVSLGTDLRMVLSTVRSLFETNTGTVRSASTRGSFLGYDPEGRVVTSHTVPLRLLKQIIAEHNLADVAEEKVLSN